MSVCLFVVHFPPPLLSSLPATRWRVSFCFASVCHWLAPPGHIQLRGLSRGDGHALAPHPQGPRGKVLASDLQGLAHGLSAATQWSLLLPRLHFSHASTRKYLCLSVSATHAHTRKHTHTHARTRTRTRTHSPSFCLSVCLSHPLLVVPRFRGGAGPVAAAPPDPQRVDTCD